MSVVDGDYEQKLRKYNLNEIFHAKMTKQPPRSSKQSLDEANDTGKNKAKNDELLPTEKNDVAISEPKVDRVLNTISDPIHNSKQ